MREKNLLIWEKKRGNLAISSLGGGDEVPIEHLIKLLAFTEQLKKASLSK